MAITGVSHIHLDGRGVAWIEETNVKVVEVVLDQLTYGWSPEEIHFQHPDLSLGQIHAALGFDHDNRAELDADVSRLELQVDRLRSETLDPPVRQRLRAARKLA